VNLGLGPWRWQVRRGDAAGPWATSLRAAAAGLGIRAARCIPLPAQWTLYGERLAVIDPQHDHHADSHELPDGLAGAVAPTQIAGQRGRRVRLPPRGLDLVPLLGPGGAGRAPWLPASITK
jgi:hypothetical protein